MKSRKQQCAVVMGLVLAMCGSAAAEEVFTQMKEVVVTATRDEIPIEQVGSSITVVTAKEIELQQKQTVADVLRMVPGLDVATNGSFGVTSVYMRGAKAEHTLVLMDGVEMNDPSHPNGGYNFANLTVQNIERIEILRGPQSTLYGSQAMGGVINLITKRGEGKPEASLSIEAGSHHTFQENANLSGSTRFMQYALDVSRLDTGGISAANSKNGNTENDLYQNSTVSARIGIAPTDNLDFDGMVRYTRSHTALDGYPPPLYSLSDVPGYYLTTDQLYVRGEANLSLFNNLWEQKLGVSLNDSRQDYSDSSYLNGQSVKADWQHILHINRLNDLTCGVEHKEDHAESDGMERKHAHTTSVYVQDHLKLFDRWFTTLGLRVDDHSSFGTEATYRLTTAYNVLETGTKIRGSYGTGFRSPSLYELYAPALPMWGFLGGEPDLKPEKSRGWDVGLEQSIPSIKTTIGLSWFSNTFKDMIRYTTDPLTWSSYYENAARAHARGAEITAALQPFENLQLKAAYTYTETEDDTIGSTTYGKEWTYRPKHKYSIDTSYRFLQKGTINLGLIYVGNRYRDSSNTQKMGNYTLVNLAGSYDITKNLQLFGRIDNLFDREYEEVYGYGTPGISAYGGVKVSF